MGSHVKCQRLDHSLRFCCVIVIGSLIVVTFFFQYSFFRIDQSHFVYNICFRLANWKKCVGLYSVIVFIVVWIAALWQEYLSNPVSGGSGHYDPYHRNPMYCNAEKECIWELKQLANHFHPTVSLYASKLIKVKFIIKCNSFLLWTFW